MERRLVSSESSSSFRLLLSPASFVGEGGWTGVQEPQDEQQLVGEKGREREKADEMKETREAGEAVAAVLL